MGKRIAEGALGVESIKERGGHWGNDETGQGGATKKGGALKGHMETYYPVAPSFKKEGLEGDAICSYIMLHP